MKSFYGEKKYIGNLTILIIISMWGILLLMSSLLFATMETFSVSSPPTPVGSGARAMGLGGAFVAIADDATAASWNPAGLIQLQKPEISGAYSWERRTTRRYSLASASLNSEEESAISSLNYLSMVYPFSLKRRNMVFSINYQKLYDFYRNLYVKSDGISVDEFHAKGTLYALSPAFALQVTEDFFLGGTINIWNDTLTGRSNWKNIQNNATYNLRVEEEYKNFRGINTHIGVLYKLTPQLNLGLVYKSPFRAHFDYHYYNKDKADPIYGILKSLDFPPTYALGLSYRISDAWTLSGDVTRRDWSQLKWRNSKGKVFGLYSTISDLTLIAYSINPTYAYRIGTEYLKITERTVIPFRFGIFYDPIPGIGRPHDEYGVSIGSGISVGDLIIDFAYEYRVRHDVPGIELGWFESLNTFEDQKQRLFLVSTIYHF